MEKYKSIVLDSIRALKSIEWAGKLDDVCWECCLFCEGAKTGPICRRNVYSSRICQRGTSSCEIDHGKAGHLPNCEFVRILSQLEEDFE